MVELSSVDVSRNPNDYRPDPGGHFRRRKRERDIPGTVIRKAIESGEIAPDEATDDDYIALLTEYLGHDWKLVVDPVEQYVVSAICSSWHD